MNSYFDLAGVEKKVGYTRPLPVTSSLPGMLYSKTVTFTGAAGVGAIGTIDLFRVTGDVLVRIFGACVTDLASAGGGTISVGYAADVDALIAVTTATDIDANELWKDNSPDVSMGDLSTLPLLPVVNGQDIIANILVGNITSGQITFYMFVVPLSSDAAIFVS